MKKIVGMICPYCKTELTADDDIVLCSECEMPHHKECWVENQGCTTFGCNGTIQSTDTVQASANSEEGKTDVYIEMNPSDTNVSYGYCHICGNLRNADDSFCPYCGHCFATNNQGEKASNGGNGITPPKTPPVSNNETDTSDERQYISQNGEYYCARFNEMRTGNKKTSWNWAAFILTPYWCIYRKLHGLGAAWIAAGFVLSFLGVFGGILLIAGKIVFAIFANYLYMQRINRLDASGIDMPEHDRHQHIQIYGGTNAFAAAFIAVGYVLLNIIYYNL